MEESALQQKGRGQQGPLEKSVLRSNEDSSCLKFSIPKYVSRLWVLLFSKIFRESDGGPSPSLSLAQSPPPHDYQLVQRRADCRMR